MLPLMGQLGAFDERFIGTTSVQAVTARLMRPVRVL
jgi:hypothetical protein